MKNVINTTPEHILSTGTLKKSGDAYTLVTLGINDIEHILALQQKVYDALSPTDKNFLLLKDHAFFEKHFAMGNAVLGIIHNGQLAAQSVIVNPTAANPKSGMVDMILAARPDEITVIQGVVVDPAYRGNNLMSVMTDAWLSLANAQGRTHAIAEVTVQNQPSWSVLMKEGLKIHSIGYDTDDGATLYNLHAGVKPLMNERLKDAFNKKSVKKAVAVPKADIERQKTLIAKGYLGVQFDAANDNLLFKKKCGRKPNNKGWKI